MAIFVTSDPHGHVRALDHALELASPSADDTIYVLGDMTDRGPDPMGVVKLVRGLPNAHVLMGNHERMLLDVLNETGDFDSFTWSLNGGLTTATGLDSLPHEEFIDTLDWIGSLPLFDIVHTDERTWILVHAGIDALEARAYLATAGVDVSGGAGAAAAPEEVLRAMMEQQDPETLLWTRAEFWGEPTGLVGADGSGPVVVAGHTPSIYIAHYADLPDSDGVTAEGLGCIVHVGACEATGGVADRIDIDCSAAAGAGQGRVGIMRLDDGEMFYATIKSGE